MARRKKKLPKITVQTVANGYTLNIQGHTRDYMYFTPETLLEGFMVHVGMKMTDQLSLETIKSFIDSALQWNDLKKSTNEINRLKNELNNLQRNRNGLARRLVHERERCLTLIEILKAPTSRDQKLRTMNMKVRNYGSLKQLRLQDLGVTAGDIEEEGDD